MLNYLTLKLIYLGESIFKNSPAPCNDAQGNDACTHFPQIDATSDSLTKTLQVVFGVIAAVTVVYIIIAAIRYAVALGDPAATAKLRNTIIWACVGLAIVLSAEAIVTFALGRV